MKRILEILGRDANVDNLVLLSGARWGVSEQLEAQIEELVSLIRSGRYLVAFSGAGISTESGIPDFRGPRGIWTKMRPIELSEFLADPASRREYWRRKLDSYPLMRNAEANEGHLALARLFEAGLLKTMITQNIDGLHQKAGISDGRVIELHGSNAYISCLQCRKRFEWEGVLPFFDRHPAPSSECPRCDDCGGWLKPATISFGQALPQDVLRESIHLSEQADLFLAMGSSLVVQPAASLPSLAKQNDARLVIINRDPTPVDSWADVVIRGPIGEVLTDIDAALRKE